jgi:quinol monooxygenase YgiN
MYALIGLARARPHCELALHRALDAIRARATLEPGCLHYHVGRDEDASEVLVLYMEWSSRDAFEAHLSTTYVRHFHAGRGRLLADDVVFRRLPATPPR